MSNPSLPALASSPLTLTCSVEVVPFLAVGPMIVWARAGGQTVTGTLNGLTSQLSFDPVVTADTDQYTCIATVNVPMVDITDRTGNASVDLTVNGE